MFRISLAALCVAATPALACPGFEAHDPYAISATPMSPTGAAFMMIHNTGTTDCHIASVRSAIAARTELHTHLAGDDGVMRMIHVEEGFALPVDGTVELARGGHHVMFLGLNEPLQQDQVIDVTFVFGDGTEAVVPVTVDLTRLGGDHASGHSSGHGHATHGN